MPSNSGTHRTTLLELAADISHERDHLLQLAAAMQLVPQNATKWARFERLLEAVSATVSADPQRRVSAQRLGTLLAGPPIASGQVVSDEDPFEETFTAEISFFGGSYRMVLGGASGAHVACQLVLNACLRLDDALDEFRRAVFADATVILTLADEICRRAGLGRWELPTYSARSPLIVPGPADLDELCECITFDDAELAGLLGSAADLVEPLVSRGPLGLIDHDHESPTDGRIYLYPLLAMSDGRLVVALPGGLCASLSHRALARAVERGIAKDLVTAIHDALQSQMRRWFGRLRWRRVRGPALPPPTTFSELFYRFDTDKVAHVVSVVDPLEGYEAGDPFGMADFQVIQDDIHKRFVAVRDAVRSADPDVSVLHLVCTAPLGRSSFLGFTDEAVDERSALLALTSDDLDVLTGNDPDPLGPWKFAVALDRLHERSRVLSFSKLDEYAIYLDHGRGFYMGDDSRPTRLTFSPGSGGELRCEERRRRDDHAAALPSEQGIVDVSRWRADEQAPIYCPGPESLSHHHLVELGAPCWVVPAPSDATEEAASEDLAEAVAFWLWRCEHWISASLRSISASGSPLVIDVRFQADDGEDGDSALDPVADWLEMKRTGDSRISLTMLPGAARRLRGPSNDGERLMAAVLAQTISAMSGDDTDIASRVYVGLPAGPMKMFHVFGADDEQFLTLGFTAQPRVLPSADVELLLDDIGTLVSDVIGLEEGPIEGDRRTAVLNEIVGHLFERLKERLADLDPTGLLEQLAVEQEALAFLAVRNRLLVPSQAACFGDDSSAVRKARESSRDVTTTAIANRFLIECVTALPPTGGRPLGVGLYDELLAIANQIVQYGYLSDAIWCDVAETELGLLPSGRLGISRDEPYHAAVAAHVAALSDRTLDDARRQFERHWARPATSPSAYDPTDLDAAFAAEWGVTATQLSHLSGELIDISRGAPRQVATRTLDELTEEVAERLEWSPALVASALPMLSLGPLDHYPPFTNAVDVYPWRFSRDRSAARRPLLQRPTASGTEVVWGPRAVYRSGRYLLDQVVSDRLKVVQSHEMRQYITRTRQAETSAFNDAVARCFHTSESVSVRKKVKRVGKLKLARQNGDDIGDIDVLVIDVEQRVILAVETKDFEFARTPVELSNELEKLFGESESAVTHHSERLEFLVRNRETIHEVLGLPGVPRDWQVRGLIVTSMDLVGARFPQVRRLPKGLNLASMRDVEQEPHTFTMRSTVNRSTRSDRRQRRRRRN
jgi:hypothetical protein